MSPKNYSLAVDERKAFQDLHLEEFTQPELKILINTKGEPTLSLQEDVVKVEGKITISF